MDKMPSFPKGEPAFIPLLKEHRPFTPNWAEKKCPEDCLDTTKGIFLKCSFPDDEKLLETAYADLQRFLSEAGINGNDVKVQKIVVR